MSAEYRPLLIFVMTNLPGLATNVTTAYIMTEYVSSVNISDTMVDVPEKPYHHGSLDQALVEAGVEAVRDVGISKLSLRDLARNIGVSSSATYRHFPSREYFEMRVSQRCREALAQAMNDASAQIVGSNTKRRSVERFEAIGRAYVNFAVSNPTLFEAAFSRNEVGIYHETIMLSDANVETVYGNMPTFGLAGVTGAVTAQQRGQSARTRLTGAASETPAVDPY